MSVIGSNILAGASGQGGYFLTNSLRFRSSASAYLSRTPASAGNRRTWTWSAWVKRSELSSNQSLFAVNNNGNDYQEFRFQDSNTLRLILDASANNYAVEVPTVVWRDVSAWYHIVLAVDTTQATSTNQVKIYVNGIQQTVSALSGFSFPAQNFDTYVNATLPHAIGNFNYNNSAYFNGYMTEINFVNAQQLTPSSFGETSTTTGVWIPKKYTGTYGTNGFYLPFTDNSALTTSSNVGLGKDFSGNSNYWTTNGISITSGSTYDSMTDVPTLTSATAGNYAVFNPLAKGANVTISDGNLKYSSNSASGTNGIVSMYITTGMKSYFEFTCGSAATYRNIAIGGMTYTGDGGSISGGTGGTGTFATWTTGDVIRFACDFTAGTIACYKNATLQTTVTGVTNTSPWEINAAQAVGLGEYTVNFGQQPFAHSIPTGFVALNTFNLPTPTIGATASTTANEYMDATLFTATAGTNTIVNAGGFQPDLVWIKSRNNPQNHYLVDSVRGGTSLLQPNITNAESIYSTPAWIISFNSNGFTSSTDSLLSTSYTYVGWQWKANGAGVTNTAGSITSTVSANTSAGFSIVTYTGVGGSGTTTVGHGLGVSPSMVIIKRRNSTADWATYHTGLTSTSYYLFLNSTAGQANYGSTFISPSSSTLTIDAGSSLLNTSTGTYVAYCFAQVAGYSAMGSYTGNGSDDGTFVFTGFRPRFLMVKRTDTTSDWVVIDSARNTYNAAGNFLYPNSSAAEDVTTRIDFVSNGFKWRTTAGCNNSGSTWIYMAVAENPFKYAVAR